MKSLRSTVGNRSLLHSGMLASMMTSAMLPAGPANAQQTNPYSVSQPIDLKWTGTQVPELKFEYYVYAFGRTDNCTSTANPVPGPPPGNLLLSSTVPLYSNVPIVKQIHAVTTNSWAKATSSALVTISTVGNQQSVEGEYTTSGEVHPSALGCDDGAPGAAHAGSATAEAKADVLIKNGPEMRKGKVGVNGKWQRLGKLGSVGPTTGRGRNRITAKDPIIARLYDLTTGVTTEYVLSTVLVSAGEGFIDWENGILSSDAAFLSFDLKIESPVTLQQGRLRLIVEDGLVTERIATGIFSGGMGLPAVGHSGIFSIPFPAITLDYDLGGDETHTLETEIEFNCGVEKEDLDFALDTGGSLINDIGVGFGGSNVSVVPPGDSNLGFGVNNSVRHLAERFVVAPGTQDQLSFLSWPVYEIDSDWLNLAGAYVRLWRGNPMNGGVLVAGDMFTNRLLAVHPTSFYRVGAATLTSKLRKVKEAVIDMRWAPLLTPGEYWIEVAVDGVNSPAVFSPTGVWKSPADSAITFDVASGQWMQVRDSASQRLVSFPFKLFGEVLPGPSCPADITHDGFVNVNDLLMVINNWGQSGGPADITNDNFVNVNDLLAVINAWGSCQAGFK